MTKKRIKILAKLKFFMISEFFLTFFIRVLRFEKKSETMNKNRKKMEKPSM